MKPIIQIQAIAEAVEFFFQQTLDAFNRLPPAGQVKLRRGMAEIMRFAESTLSEYERSRLQQEGVNAVRRSGSHMQADGYWSMGRLKDEVARIADRLHMTWRFNSEGDALLLKFKCNTCGLDTLSAHGLERWRLECFDEESIEQEIAGFVLRESVTVGLFHKEKSPTCRDEMRCRRLTATSCETHPEAIVDHMNSQPMAFSHASLMSMKEAGQQKLKDGGLDAVWPLPRQPSESTTCSKCGRVFEPMEPFMSNMETGEIKCLVECSTVRSVRLTKSEPEPQSKPQSESWRDKPPLL